MCAGTAWQVVAFDSLPASVPVHCAVYRDVNGSDSNVNRTEHGLWRSAGTQQRGQAEVADLDDSLSAVDEDVVALQVAVDDGRVVAVEVDQPA